MSAHIASIYRYPVKGFTGERLEQVALKPGETLPFDRAYAIENGPGAFDESAPRHLPKVAFLCLMRNERLAAFDASFDDQSQMFTLARGGVIAAQGTLSTLAGRAAIETYLASELAAELRGRPRVVSAAGHSFSDVRETCIHIIRTEQKRLLIRLESLLISRHLKVDITEVVIRLGGQVGISRFERLLKSSNGAF